MVKVNFEMLARLGYLGGHRHGEKQLKMTVHEAHGGRNETEGKKF